MIVGVKVVGSVEGFGESMGSDTHGGVPSFSMGMVKDSQNEGRLAKQLYLIWLGVRLVDCSDIDILPEGLVACRFAFHLEQLEMPWVVVLYFEGRIAGEYVPCPPILADIEYPTSSEDLVLQPWSSEFLENHSFQFLFDIHEHTKRQL